MSGFGGGVRMRPKNNRPSITNKSGMDGGLFGREPQNYGTVVPQEPVQMRMGRANGGGLDFMSQLEDAEARDSHRQQLQAYEEQQWQAANTKNRRREHELGNFTFNDEFDARNRAKLKQEMYQTSNGATNSGMQQAHVQAVQRSQEGKVRQMLREHGLDEQQVEREVQLWRQDVAGGRASATPFPEEAPEQPKVRGGAHRGENGRILQDTAFEDPFKKRAARSATPPKSKPWDINDPFKDGPRGSSPPQSKSQPWAVEDPFKSRGPAARSQDAAWMNAAGSGKVASAGGQRGHGFSVDPNRSSISGGIFAGGGDGPPMW